MIILRNDLDKIKVELSDGDHRPYYRRKVNIDNKKDVDELADDLWNIRQVELLRKKRRENTNTEESNDDLIGGGKFF